MVSAFPSPARRGAAPVRAGASAARHVLVQGLVGALRLDFGVVRQTVGLAHSQLARRLKRLAAPWSVCPSSAIRARRLRERSPCACAHRPLCVATPCGHCSPPRRGGLSRASRCCQNRRIALPAGPVRASIFSAFAARILWGHHAALAPQRPVTRVTGRRCRRSIRPWSTQLEGLWAST